MYVGSFYGVCNVMLIHVSQDGTTALAAAVSKNAYEMVQMLIEKAADVNCTQVRNHLVYIILTLHMLDKSMTSKTFVLASANVCLM